MQGKHICILYLQNIIQVYIYMLFFYNCANCVKFYYFFFYQKHVHSILMKITWSKLISHNIILYSVKSWLVQSLIVFSESAPGEKCINGQPPIQCSVITSECISAIIGSSDYRCICKASYYRDGQECKSCNLFTLQYAKDVCQLILYHCLYMHSLTFLLIVVKRPNKLLSSLGVLSIIVDNFLTHLPTVWYLLVFHVYTTPLSK